MIFVKLPDGSVEVGFLTPLTIHEKTPVGYPNAKNVARSLLPVSVHEISYRFNPFALQFGDVELGGRMS